MDPNNQTQTPASTETSTVATVARKPRGFAAMTLAQRQTISSKGGKVAHATGKAHEFTPEEARNAGRKGGQASHSRKKTVSVQAE